MNRRGGGGADLDEEKFNGLITKLGNETARLEAAIDGLGINSSGHSDMGGRGERPQAERSC